jgi:hypothetical protein
LPFEEMIVYTNTQALDIPGYLLKIENLDELIDEKV